MCYTGKCKNEDSFGKCIKQENTKLINLELCNNSTMLHKKCVNEKHLDICVVCKRFYNNFCEVLEDLFETKE